MSKNNKTDNNNSGAPPASVRGTGVPPAGKVDIAAIEQAVRQILVAVGEDPTREGLLDTPGRVARMYQELFAGLYDDPDKHLKVGFTEKYDEMVVLRDISFFSMCEHHLLPFMGKAHIAYLPRGKVIGVSKLARTVEAFARRPQLQERLTSQIADELMQQLDPQGVAVLLEAEHTCMTIRGVKKPGSKMVTSAIRGLFKTNLATRTEAINLLTGR
jgi:GTP cyclohydrolase I